MDDVFDNVVHQMANAQVPTCVEAAAGCGKTEAIAKAVEQAKGKQLILTHTHAGIAALRSRLAKNNVSPTKYRITTIASFLLRYVLAYPSMSGFTNPRPSSSEWSQVYPAAKKLFIFPFIKDVLCASYERVFVDEYQDCTKSQHAIVKKISESIPVCVLGDPLQGIFNFVKDDPAIDWEKDIRKDFTPTPPLQKPYRWLNDGNNSELGEQISDIRISLLADKPIDLRNYSQINWAPWSEEQEKKVLLTFNKTGKVAGIHAGHRVNNEHLDRIIGKRTNGRYQCIEEMDCYALQTEAHEFDKSLGKNIFQLRHRLKLFIQQGITDQPEQTALQEVNAEIDQLDLNNFITSIPMIINLALKKLPIYRKELLQEMKKAAQQFDTGKYVNFSEAAYVVRDKTRINGRLPENRIISRTLLVKGLEFDHVIVLNADHFYNGNSPKSNFYVAISRGAKSLTVLSSSPVFR